MSTTVSVALLVRSATAWTLMALCAAGCSSVRFEPHVAGERPWPISRKVAVPKVEDASTLRQPVANLGLLVLPAGSSPGTEAEAVAAFQARAWRFGCDALMLPKLDDAPPPSTGKRWVISCLRSAATPLPKWASATRQPAPPPPVAERPVDPLTPPPPLPGTAPAAAAAPAPKSAAANAAKPQSVQAVPRPTAEQSAREKSEAAARAQVEAADAAARAKALAADADAKRKFAEQEARKAQQEADRLRKDEAASNRQARQAEADRAREAAAEAERARKAALAEEQARKAEAARLARDKAEQDRAAQAQARKSAAEADAKARADAAEARKAAADAEARARVEAQEARRAAAVAETEARRAAAIAEAKARAEAAEARKQQAVADAKAKVQAEQDERARKQADADAAARKKAEDAEADKRKKLAEAEEAARKKAEADKLAAAESQSARAAAARQAIEDRNSAGQIEFLVKHPDAPEAAQVFAALQLASVAESANWLSDVQCAASKEFATRRLPPPNLQAELATAKRTAWRSLVPRDLQCSFSVRNPSQHPVVVELDLAGNRTWRFLQPRQSGSLRQALRCVPEAPVASVAGEVVEFRWGCAVAGPTRLTGVRPAAAELAVDKRAAEPGAPLELMAKVWQAQPNTRLGPVYAAAVADRLRRDQEDVSQVSGKATVLGKEAPDKDVPVRVEFRNLAARDLTVLYTAGTGRDERLVLPRGGQQELTVQGRAGQDHQAYVTRLLPKLRSLDWLVGSWTLASSRLVLLPDGKGGLWAFPLDVGADGLRRAVPAAVEVIAGVVRFRATLGGAYVTALLPKAACGAQCEVAFSARLSDQDQYAVLGPRQLIVELEAGGAKATIRFAEE